MTDKVAQQYTISTDSLDTLQFTEFSGSVTTISVPTGRTLFNGEVIEEPSYTKKMVMEPTGTFHVREIRETYAPTTAWKYLLAMKNFILTSGNNWTFDSFNSNYGPYTGSQKTASAILACRGGFVGTPSGIQFGTDKIYGYIDSTPLSASVSTNNTSVGDIAWVDAGSSSIQDGHLLYDALTEYWNSDFCVFNTTDSPFATATTLPAFDIVMSASADYTGSTVSLTAGRTWTIVSGSQIRVKITGTFSNTTTGLLSIDSGSSLKIYAYGTNITLTPSAMNNLTASNFIIYAQPSVTNVGISGVSCCCIEAPNAAVAGGSATRFTGYIIGKSMNLNGGSGFLHFDSAVTRPVLGI